MKYINIKEITDKSYRQEQLDNGIFKQLANSFFEIQTLPDKLRDQLEDRFKFPTIEPLLTNPDWKQASIKMLFKCKKDNKTFESVLLRHRNQRRTVCLSTQIGCAMKCRFCATGQMGFIRNLSYREIVDQALYFARELLSRDSHITNLVYMGMGEPFLNPDNTTKSISILNDPKQFELGARNITISTVGIIKPMKDFFEKFPQINLAISLHSAIEEKRRQLMPLASKVSLSELAKYIRYHIERYNRRVSLEYLMLAGVNDQQEDLEALIEFTKNLGSKSRKLIHINLIPFNKISDNSLASSSPQQIKKFKDKLLDHNIKTTIRKSLGKRKNAACGMLKTDTR